MPPAPAPWRPLFLTHLTKTPTTTFTLSTLAQTTTGTGKKCYPRSRTVEFRGFWPNLSPLSLHPSAINSLETQGIGLNPDVYESDLFSITTDVRMGKVGEIEEGEGEGVVEGVFWFAGTVQTQWRVRGVGVVLGSGSGDEKGREVVWGNMRVKPEYKDKDKYKQREEEVKDWNWDRQITTYFANHSPAMRGTFKNPPPGQPRSEAPSNPALKIGQKVEDLNDPVARENFRVVVIVPEEVERLDLSDQENVRRTRWVLCDGVWGECELWP